MISFQRLVLTRSALLVVTCLTFFALTVFWNTRRDDDAEMLRDRYYPENPSPAVVTDCVPEDHIDQFDPCLIKYARRNALLPPSGLPFHPSEKAKKQSTAANDKFAFIKKHLIDKGSLNGFFIECGAHDGEFLSQTLKLERNTNWTGLLVEANAGLFQQLVKVHRNAWMTNVALCTTNHSDVIRFYDAGASSSLTRKEGAKATNVPCLPLYTLLAALNITTVDFFSLDAEGADLDILKTIPFDKVKMKLITMENYAGGKVKAPAVQFMTTQGYKYAGKFSDFSNIDLLFVHESVYTKDMQLKKT